MEGESKVMSLEKYVPCVNGGHHHLFSVDKPIEPIACRGECLKISSKTLQTLRHEIELKESREYKERQRKFQEELATRNAPKEIATMKTNQIVTIDDKFYELVPSTWTVEKLLNTNPKQRPFLRVLQPMENNSATEQKQQTNPNKENQMAEKKVVSTPVETVDSLTIKLDKIKDKSSAEARKLRIKIRSLKKKEGTAKAPEVKKDLEPKKEEGLKGNKVIGKTIPATAAKATKPVVTKK